MFAVSSMLNIPWSSTYNKMKHLENAGSDPMFNATQPSIGVYIVSYYTVIQQ